MERIAIDMDGVIADVSEQFFRYDEKDFGKRRSLDEVVGRKEIEAFPRLREYVYSKGFFKSPLRDIHCFSSHRISPKSFRKTGVAERAFSLYTVAANGVLRA